VDRKYLLAAGDRNTGFGGGSETEFHDATGGDASDFRPP
jgi:hypothetical protein